MHRITIGSLRPGRRRRIVLVTALGIAALGFVAAFCGRTAMLGQTAPPLTVKETVGLVFARFHEGPPDTLVERANPEARDALRRIVANDELVPYHGMAWGLLGRFGEESDVRRIEQTTKTGFSGTLSREEFGSVRSMIRALAPMCRRHVSGSCELLVAMQAPSYWTNAGFRLFDRPMPQRPPFEYELIGYVMRSYAKSGKPNLEARTESILDQIGDPGVKKMMALELDPKVLRASAEPANDKGLSGFDDPITDEMLRELRASFNGDLNDPRPLNP